MEEPDVGRFQRQARAEAELLRLLGREADLEVAAIVADARERREGLRRERNRSRSTERASRLGEDRQPGAQPDPLDATDAQRQ